DEGGARAQERHLRVGGRVHRGHDVGAPRGGRVADRRARRLVGGVGERGPRTGVVLDDDLVPERPQALDRARGRGDEPLPVPHLAGDTDPHVRAPHLVEHGRHPCRRSHAAGAPRAYRGPPPPSRVQRPRAVRRSGQGARQAGWGPVPIPRAGFARPRSARIEAHIPTPTPGGTMRRTTTRPIVLASAAALCAVALAGCTASASANLTVPASKIAQDAEGALAEIGEADVDCGDGTVDLVDGEVVECELTDPATGTVYDTTVTLSDVEGTNYHVDVQVAETPKA